MDIGLFIGIILAIALGVALGIDIARHPKEYLGNLLNYLLAMGVFIVLIAILIGFGLGVIILLLFIFVPETRGFLLAGGVVVFALLAILSFIIEVKNKGLKRAYRNDAKGKNK